MQFCQDHKWHNSSIICMQSLPNSPSRHFTMFLHDLLNDSHAMIHIACLQCPKTRWRSCPACQRRIQEQELEDEYELQSWFIRRINRFLSAQGKQLIGWDEILEGGLAQGACVMSWRVSHLTKCLMCVHAITIPMTQYTVDMKSVLASAGLITYKKQSVCSLDHSYVMPRKTASHLSTATSP